MPQQRSSWIAAAGLAALLVAPPAADGHIHIVESRQHYNSPVYQADNFADLKKNAGAYNAGGQVEVQKRARKLTDPDLLKEYGDGYYDDPAAAPVDEQPTAAPVDDGEGEDGEKAEYVGCFHDNKEDRVLGDQLKSSTMTTAVCQQHCTTQGAVFMATQFGFECWCSADGGLDYNRHYEGIGEDAVCDLYCQGDETETCGGFNSFDLYKLPMSCSGDPVGVYEQCGGADWAGSTCCSEDNECTVMGDGCYSQCRPPTTTDKGTPAPTPAPVADETTPAPVMEDMTPAPEAKEATPAPVEEATPAPVEELITPAPVVEATPAPVPEATPAPVVEATRAPVGEQPTSDDGSGCMVVQIEAESLAISGDWSVVQDGDASGGKYITWLGLSSGQNNRDAADGDIISTPIEIPTAGTYSFKWLMRQPDGVDSDKGNDAWLYFPDADRYGPEGTSNGYGEFIKVYGRATKGEFEYSGTGEDSNGHTQIALEFDQAGEYTMEISGRSHGLQIDKILVFGDDLSVDEAAANTGC